MDTIHDIIEHLAARHETLSVAESCTGGLVATAIVAVPGASRVFTEGIVAYADEVKTARLGVKSSIIERHGAVSAETVRAMLAGLRTDARIAVSGIAGPGGGSAAKPVGTVVIGVRYLDKERMITHRFTGDRDAVRQAAVREAFALLRALLVPPS
ncbi:MAG TPA: CinA family protein [bacterium]|nr:CinA family protein [bacterium]